MGFRPCTRPAFASYLKETLISLKPLIMTLPQSPLRKTTMGTGYYATIADAQKKMIAASLRLNNLDGKHGDCNGPATEEQKDCP